MIIPPTGSMPTPVAPAVSVPTIAPVAAPTPAPDAGGDRDQDGDRPGYRTPLYDRRGHAAGQDKGRLVNRRA